MALLVVLYQVLALCGDFSEQVASAMSQLPEENAARLMNRAFGEYVAVRRQHFGQAMEQVGGAGSALSLPEHGRPRGARGLPTWWPALLGDANMWRLSWLPAIWDDCIAIRLTVGSVEWIRRACRWHRGRLERLTWVVHAASPRDACPSPARSYWPS